MKTFNQFIGPFFLGMAVVASIAATQQNSESIKYQYLVRQFNPTGFTKKARDSKMTDEINQQIEQGWELHSFHAANENVSRVVFRRAKNQ